MHTSKYTLRRVHKQSSRIILAKKKKVEQVQKEWSYFVLGVCVPVHTGAHKHGHSRTHQNTGKVSSDFHLDTRIHVTTGEMERQYELGRNVTKFIIHHIYQLYEHVLLHIKKYSLKIISWVCFLQEKSGKKLSESKVLEL
jgi:hypothetical protein